MKDFKLLIEDIKYYSHKQKMRKYTLKWIRYIKKNWKNIVILILLLITIM